MSYDDYSERINTTYNLIKPYEENDYCWLMKYYFGGEPEEVTQELEKYMANVLAPIVIDYLDELDMFEYTEHFGTYIIRQGGWKIQIVLENDNIWQYYHDLKMDATNNMDYEVKCIIDRFDRNNGDFDIEQYMYSYKIEYKIKLNNEEIMNLLAGTSWNSFEEMFDEIIYIYYNISLP